MKSVNKRNTFVRLADVVLFLAFIDFKGFHNFIFPLALTMQFLGRKRLYFKGSAAGVSLCIWMVFQIFWVWFNKSITSVDILIPFGIYMAYQCGKSVTELCPWGTKESEFKYYLTLMVAAISLHGVLNFIINFRAFGFGLNYVRALYDIWTAGGFTNSTGQAALFVPIIGLSYVLFAFRKELFQNRWVWCVAVVSFFVAVVYNVMNATRFIPFAVILILGSSVAVDVLVGRRSGKIKRLLWVVLLIALLLIAYNANLFSIRSMIESSGLFQRMNRLDALQGRSRYTSEDRVEQWMEIVNNLGHYLWGGTHTYEFIHNTWLDMINRWGLVVTLPFILFTFFAIVYSVRAVFVLKPCYSLLVFGLSVAFAGYLFIEPTFLSARWLVFAYTFFTGQISAVLSIKACQKDTDDMFR